MRTPRTIALLPLLLGVAFALMPIAASAQAAASSTAASAQLQTTIRAELLSDPRTSSLSKTQLDAIVSLLAQQAEAQGITSEDITWRPVQYTSGKSAASAAAPASQCGGVPSFLCSLNQALGFDGSDPTIPIGLGVTAALLLLIIGTTLEMHHRHHLAQMTSTQGVQ